MAVLAELSTLQAQTWQTVLDYQLYPGQSADGKGIAADPAGRVLSVGTAGTNSQGIALTTDTTQLANGASAVWNLSDDTLLNNPAIDPSQYTSDIYGCGYDSYGNLYSVGQLWPIATPGEAFWYIRKSSDGGQSWSTLYEPDGSLYQYTPGQWAWPTGFAGDDSGNIYVVGQAHSATTTGSGKRANTQITNHWIVRKSSDTGQTWTLVDDLVGSPGASAVALVPGIGVFVAGPYFSPGPWLVRKSGTGDAGTWSTVDGPITNAHPQGVCSDSLGNVYVVGTQFIVTGTITVKGKTQTTGYDSWVTRMSSDGGNTWSTVDSSANWAPNTSGFALGAARDSTGSVVVVGRASLTASDGKTHNNWIVRRRDATTGVWSALDDFLPVNGSVIGNAAALKAATDASGHLLVTGWANSGDTTGEHLIVRRF